MKWKKYFICLLVLLPALFSFIFSLSANATSYSISSFALHGQINYGNANTWQTGLSYSGTNMHSVYQFEIHTSSITAEGKFYTIQMATQINTAAQTTIVTGQGFTVTQCVVGSTPLTINNASVTTNGNDQGVSFAINVSAEAESNTLTGQLYCTVRSNNGIYFIQSDGTTSYNVSFGNSSVNVNYTSTLSEELLEQQINQNNTIINQNATIIEGVGQTTDAVNNMSQNLQNKLDEQTQQEQDQYDQEKQEESEREQSGNEDADQMAGVFQFSIPNPFLPILSMFTDGGSCVSIPTIASMVGSDNTQFCPWFPASVRDVLTPVIGLSSSIILFGFIISWLTGATRGSIEEVVEVSK